MSLDPLNAVYVKVGTQSIHCIAPLPSRQSFPRWRSNKLPRVFEGVCAPLKANYHFISFYYGRWDSQGGKQFVNVINMQLLGGIDKIIIFYSQDLISL